MLTKLSKEYKKYISLSEIENSSVLQFIHFALLIGFWVSFNDWVFRKHISIETFLADRHVCLPYFQDCGNIYFLNARPMGYSQSFFYAVLFALICLSAYYAVKKQWLLAHITMVPLFFWKVMVLFFLTYQVAQNFEYFHVPFVFIFLFASGKLFFLRRLFVVLYFLAATVKFHDSWITGSYFTSLQLGIPLFPKILTPFLTNFVIFLEIVGSWALLSANRKVRLTAVVIWLLFHLYSISLVGYYYPTYCIPLLLGLFLPNVQAGPGSFNLKSLAGWVTLFLIFVVNAVPNLRAGDQKYALENRALGVFMFDSTHQCLSKETWYYKDGVTQEKQTGNVEGMNRCAPYPTWFSIQLKCKKQKDNVVKVKWEFISSINGGPYYKIVNSENACDLKFSPFTHNEWILLPEKGDAELVGFPRKTITHDSEKRGVLPVIYPHAENMDVESQVFFKKNSYSISYFWKILWLVLLLINMWPLIKFFKNKIRHMS